MANPKAFYTGIDNKSNKIINLADGSAVTDAATYGQVLALVNGKDYKDGVRAASTSNVTVSAPGTTIGAVTMATNDRFLLLGQTTASENGIWVYNGSGSPATRPADFTGSTGIVSQGATVVVDEGTLAATQWTLTTSGAINVGTTSLSFTQTTGGASYTAGNGIQIISGAISVKLPASSGLIADGTGLYLDTSIVVRKYAISIGDGSATTFTVTHSLGTKDTHVTIYDTSSGAEIEADVVHPTNVNTVTVGFNAAPGSNAFRVVVLG